MVKLSVLYNIKNKGDVFEHSLYAYEENKWYFFEFPFCETLYNFHPKFCVSCNNQKRINKKKSSLICKSCALENPELKSNLRRAKFICSIGTISNFKTEETKSKIKEHYIKKYDVEHVSQLDGVKEKKKQTVHKNYGVENPSQSKTIKEKKKQTCLKNHGVEFSSQSKEVQKKIKNSNLEKYGVEHYSKSKEGKKQKNETYYLNKYGMPFNDFKEQWLKDYYEYGLVYCKEKYDISQITLLRKYIPQEDKLIKQSLNEKMIAETIDLDFETNVRSILSNKNLEIDLLNRENMVSIEFNGFYWHQIISDRQNTDLSKAEEMRDLGYKHFALDETDMGKLKLINKMISPNKTKLYARKLSLKAIKNPKEFLDNNHLQGSVRAKIAYGLFLDDELIQTMTFGKSRFDKNIDWEILRLCTKPDCLVVGGAERLFKAFQKEYNPKSVVSYSDNKYFDGKVYGKLGLKFIENTQSNYVWWKNGISLKRYQTMKHKLKDVLGDRFDSDLTEKENMLSNGWIQIKDLGNKKWGIKAP